MRIANKVVEKFKLKDDEAFAEIFYSYRDIIFALAKERLRNVDDANDCVQEIFQKLYLNIGQYDVPRNSFNAWFMQLANNHIIDYYRKRKKEKYILDENYVSNCNYEETKISVIEELEDVLNKVEYTILVYHIVYDLTFIEIADLMNMNRETVRRTYHKSIATAREYVERIRDNER